MSLFDKRKEIILKTEQQRDAYIERLDNAHVDYDVFEHRDDVYSRDTFYVIRVKSSDLRKVS